MEVRRVKPRRGGRKSMLLFSALPTNSKYAAHGTRSINTNLSPPSSPLKHPSNQVNVSPLPPFVGHYSIAFLWLSMCMHTDVKMILM